MSIGRLLLQAAPGPSLSAVGALSLREAILSTRQLVDLRSLLSASWALRIPVIHMRIFPLEAKAMHAMVVSSGGRFAILLGRDAQYPAPTAFTLSHELGHIMCGHLGEAQALVDLEDPATVKDLDEQESEADRFALSVLTGSPDPSIDTSLSGFNAPTLANAVLNASIQYGIEPGTLALCVGHRLGNWPVAMSALQFIYSEKKPVWREVNSIADRELDWDALTDEAADFLRNVMIGADG
jgi:hypothetical protein